LKWPAVSQKYDPDSKQEGMERPLIALQSRQRAENQCSTESGNRSSPVAVHPIAEDSDPQKDQNSAQQRPKRWKIALQHPEKCGNHSGSGQQNADPRIAKQLPKRQSGALSR